MKSFPLQDRYIYTHACTLLTDTYVQIGSYRYSAQIGIVKTDTELKEKVAL